MPKDFTQLKNIVGNTAQSPPQVVAGNGTLQAALALGWSVICHNPPDESHGK
jgi:hypothetical protein